MLSWRDERPCPGDMGIDAARWNVGRLGLWEPTWSELRRDPILRSMGERVLDECVRTSPERA